MLALSLADDSARRGWQKSLVTQESAKETVKTIAQGMPVISAEPVVTAACFFCCTRAMGAAEALGIPCALFVSSRVDQCIARALRAAGMRTLVSSLYGILP